MSGSLDAFEPSPTPIHVIREVEVSAFYSSPCERLGWAQMRESRNSPEFDVLARLPPALAWTPDGSHIMFGEFRGGVLYLVDSDGSSLRRVADVGYPTNRFPKYMESSMSYGLHVDISPDGSRFAYTSCEYATEKSFTPSRERANYPDYRDNPDRYNYEVALSDMVGSNRIRLTHNNDILDHYPTWSPDGSQIAFVSGWLLPEKLDRFKDLDWLDPRRIKVGFTFDEVWGNLHIVDLDSDSRSRKVELVIHQPPKWSPDGERIAFMGRNYETIEVPRLFVMAKDGSTVLEVTDAALPIAFSWSPDGRRLAYLRFHERAQVRVIGADGDVQEVIEKSIVALHTVGVDGADDSLVGMLPETNVVSGEEIYEFGYLSEISWSPDGSAFLVLGSHGGAVIGDDGAVLHRFPHSHAAWSPDGKRIAALAFTSHRSGELEDSPGDVWLYTFAPDASDRRDLVVFGDYGALLPANPK